MRLAWVLAGRELRSGVSGFRIFLACVALGVGALSAAGSTAEAFRQGLASQSRTILGGDVAVSVDGRRFTPAERRAFSALGATSDSLRVEAMAANGPKRRLADVRGVDEAYPLAGAAVLEGARSLSEALESSGGVPGAAMEPDLAEHLGLRLGEDFVIGDSPFEVRALLLSQPDRLGRGFALGPGILTSKAALERSGLLSPDALFGETVRIILRDGRAPAAAAQALTRAFPGAGFRARGRNEAAAGLGRVIDQLEFFLSFIGLAALLAGGLGVASAVSTYLDARRPSIAVLKALGADSGLIRSVYLLQIGALALLGVMLGLAAGAACPFLLGWLAKGRLPVPALFQVYPEPLIKAAAFGLLAVLAFSLAPLARARATPPASLFRRDLGGRIAFGPEVAVLALAALGLVGLTLVTAPSPLVAVVMMAAVAGAFFVLWGLGLGAAALAGRLRGFARGAAALGLANLSGPGSAARTASPAIGFGVALLTTVVLIQSSLLSEVRDVAPAAAPSLIFTQIPPSSAAAFDAALAPILGGLDPSRYRRFPFLTGRIVGLKGRPVDRRAIAEDRRWAFDQDVTMSALGPQLHDPDLAAGAWWPQGYVGPPLVMLDADVARAAGLKVGDELTLSVLGRDLDARIAGLRRVDFGSFGASFPIIIDPDALKGANLRDIAIAKANARQESAILERLAAGFSKVNVISVREQLAQVSKIFDQLAWAVRGAAAVASLAGLLVLVGAVAATAKARSREAALLKVLGSTRLEILGAYGVEYGAVGSIAGVSGVLMGAAAAYPVTTLVFRSHWSVDWSGLVAILALTALVAGVVGAIGAFLALSRRPAGVLRAE